MKTAHELIMELYAARIERSKAESNRAHVNTMEGYRLREESISSKGYYFHGDAIRTDASKAAHVAYVEAANKQAAAMRAVMKYGKEHAE